MELIHLANIIQGNIPTRIEVSVGKSLETITMQELNYKRLQIEKEMLSALQRQKAFLLKAMFI